MRLHLYLGLLICCVFSAKPCLGETPEESFTRALLPELQSAIPTHKFEYVALLQLRDSTSGNVIYLDRIFGYVSANPKQAAAAQRNYVSQMAKAIADADRPISKRDLRLAVRNATTLRKSLEAMGPGRKAAYPKDFVGDLVVVPVIDTPSTVKYVSEVNLAAIGLTEEQAVELGTKNLRSIQKPMAEITKIPPKSGIGVINEEYAASRLIFIADWKPIEEKIGGNLIAMAPAYDTVIYGDGSTLIAVDALRTIGMQIAKQSQVPLAPTVVRLKGDHWEVVE